MLRKIKHIVLALLLLVSTSGIAISKHYCGANLKSVSILTTPESCCELPVGCCHNEKVEIEIEDDYSGASFNYDFSMFAVELPSLLESFQLDLSASTSEFHVYNYLPERRMQTILSCLQTYRL